MIRSTLVLFSVLTGLFGSWAVTQYFEMFGNRAIYHEGWFARTIHKAPWEREPRRPLAEDIWELYDTRTDFSLVTDLTVADWAGEVRAPCSSMGSRWRRVGSSAPTR